MNSCFVVDELHRMMDAAFLYGSAYQEKEKVDEMIKLYEYAVIAFVGEGDEREWKIVLKPDVMLARNENDVKWNVMRENIELLGTYKENEINVYIRPFR